MKNQKLYNGYAINGMPCHFYTKEAVNKYNNLIEKFCKKLPDNSKDLGFTQRVVLCLYVYYLDFYDAVLSTKKHFG